MVPSPAEAKVYLFGLALISAISSFAVLASIEGFTIRELGVIAASVTGMKSLNAS